jgi:hypothetical protein
MKNFNINKLRQGLNYRIPVLFMMLGCLLFTNLFFEGDRWKKIAFGIVLVLYGLFRIYKVHAKIRNIT